MNRLRAAVIDRLESERFGGMTVSDIVHELVYVFGHGKSETTPESVLGVLESLSAEGKAEFDSDGWSLVRKQPEARAEQKTLFG